MLTKLHFHVFVETDRPRENLRDVQDLQQSISEAVLSAISMEDEGGATTKLIAIDLPE